MKTKRPAVAALLAMGYLACLSGCNLHLEKAPSVPPGAVILEVEPGIPTASLERTKGIRLIHKYHGFRYYALLPRQEREGADFPSEGVAILPLHEGFVIHGEKIQARGTDRSGETSRLVTVRYHIPPTRQMLETMENHGGRFVDALPNYAALFWFPDGINPADLTSLSNQPLIADSVAFPSHPLTNQDPHDFADETVYLELQFFNDSNRVLRELSLLGNMKAEVVNPARLSPDGRFHTVSVRMPASAIRRLAELETLLHVQFTNHASTLGETSGLIVADETIWNGQKEIPTSGIDYLAWLRAKLGLGPGQLPPDGAFPIVAVVDNGVGSGDPADPQAPYSAPADFLVEGTGDSRIAFNRRWQVPGVDPGVTECGPTTTDAGYTDGHAQFVASILAGYNDGTGPANADPQGFRYGMGINPYGTIASMRLPLAPFVDVTLIPVNCIQDMVRDYWEALDTAGGTINAEGGGRTAYSTNSWGMIDPPNVVYTYDAYAQLFDYLVREVGGGTDPRHLTAVFAAGNSGNDGFSTIASPGIAKNVITVGGSECVDFRTNIPYCGSSTPYNPYGNDPFRIADNANDIWIWASKGSDQAGARIKPDIVAPASLPYGNMPNPVTCPIAGESDMVDESSQPRLYARSFGTSFATPAVAASTQLSTYFLREVYTLSDPSPALMRAYIAHSGHFLDGENTGIGQYAGDPLRLPSPRQGFGRLNLDPLLAPIPRHFVNQEVVFTANCSTLENYTVTGTVADPALPVRIVLTWTDPPAPTFGSRQGDIINDLDLSASVATSGQPAARYVGNSFSTNTGEGDLSRPYYAGQPVYRDRANNMEAIFLAPPGAGTEMTVVVSPYRVIRDCFFEAGVTPRQDFALVVSNFIADNP